MKKNLYQQSQSYFKKYIAFNVPRHTSKRMDHTSAGIHSYRSFVELSQSLAHTAKQLKVDRLKHIDERAALVYIMHRYKQGLSRKTLSRDRNALGRFLHVRLPNYDELHTMAKGVNLTDKWVKNSVSVNLSDQNISQSICKMWDKVQKGGISVDRSENFRPQRTRPNYSRRLKDISRSYTDEQIKSILHCVKDERTKLSIIIARDAGLRVSELIELRKLGEGKSVSNQRDWRSDIHKYRQNCHTYVVTGKGGLVRTVRLSPSIAQRLEQYRMSNVRVVRDRQVNYQQTYQLTFGNNLSQQFTQASMDALGFSLGAHGLRHSYAQARMSYLLGRGESFNNAKHIVSQEMGHMRMNITDTYLR